MPKKLAKAHETGDLYYHDLDSYNLTTNCLHIPTREVLEKGFNTGYGTINSPKRIETAAELSCILLQSTQNDMFGGQSHPDFDNDLGIFVEPTRKEIKKELEELGVSSERIEGILEKKVTERIHQAMQGVVFNLNTMHSRAGSQVPFSSVNIGIPNSVNTMHSRAGSQVPFSSVNIGIPNSDDAALVCEIFLEEYEKGLGKGEQPIFPNIIFRVKEGVNREEGDPYYYLYELACRVAAKRMNPTFMNIDADFNKEYYDKGYMPATMGCRTYLLYELACRVAAKRMNPTFMNIDADFNKEYYDKGYMPATMGCRTYLMKNVNGEPGCKGRGNIAPTTINLPRIGIQAKGDIDKFFELFQERIDLAEEALMHRYGILKNLRVKDLPFVAGQHLMKGSEGLNEEDSIEPILKQGTWGIGFIGLAETLVALTGKHHGEDPASRELGEKIITFLRSNIDRLTEKTHLNWSCYATPAEGILKRLRVKDLPFVAGQHLMKGSEGLNEEDSIEPILKQGTWGIGFIGLAETLVALTGKHHGEDPASRELGEKIITFLRSNIDRLTEKTHLNWSCYATPAEGLSGKFIKQDQKMFGILKGITDKEYYTNSYHIPVGFPISIKDKVDIEAPYHKLCNGGHISYIEVDDNPTGDTIKDIIDYAY